MNAPLPRTGFWARIVTGWCRLWFAPAEALDLHIARVVIGLAILGTFLPLSGHIEEFFGLTGWFDQKAYAETAGFVNESPVILGWSLTYLAGNNTIVLLGIFWMFIAAAMLLTVGVLPRITSVLTWAGVVSFTANPVIDADVNALILFMSLYLMIGYFLPSHSRDDTLRWLGPLSVWPLKPSSTVESWGYRLPMRLLQCHFALAVMTSGLHKLQYGDWWSGVALWFPLNSPGEATLASVRDHAADANMYLRMISLASYIILVWQIAFPAFAWRPRWRLFVLAGGMVGFVGSWVLYKEPDFGFAFVAGCVCFVEASEWRRWSRKLDTALPVESSKQYAE